MFQQLSAHHVALADRSKRDFEEMLRELQTTAKTPFLKAVIPVRLWPVFRACGFARGAVHSDPVDADSAEILNVYAIGTSVPVFPTVPCSVVLLPISQALIRVLRLDLLHPLLMGNKWFKLKENMRVARERGYRELLTFGGAFSNHLFATAAVGKMLGWRTRGVVRGEPVSNPILDAVRANGMRCEFWERARYREKDAAFFELKSRFPEAWIIPEGGANTEGVQGARDIWRHLEPHLQTHPVHLPVHLVTACGTGSTLAGVLQGTPEHWHEQLHVHGVAVLKGADFLRQDIARFADSRPLPHWTLHTAFHGGGYARQKQGLKDYLEQLRKANPELPVEHVYTGKLFYGIDQLIQQGRFEASAVMALHTGGVYG